MYCKQCFVAVSRPVCDNWDHILRFTLTQLVLSEIHVQDVRNRSQTHDETDFHEIMTKVDSDIMQLGRTWGVHVPFTLLPCQTWGRCDGVQLDFRLACALGAVSRQMFLSVLELSKKFFWFGSDSIRRSSEFHDLIFCYWVTNDVVHVQFDASLSDLLDIRYAFHPWCLQF